MSLNNTVSAERIHIGFFGMRNAGKSSLVNAVTGQQISVVSDVKGTTTDPVKKAMELLPLGPVVIIDTAGFDDEGDLGLLRVKKTKEILATVDIAVLVVDSTVGKGVLDRELVKLFEDKKIPYITAYNKIDLSEKGEIGDNEVFVSSVTGEGIEKIKELLGKFANSQKSEKRIAADLLSKGDLAVLVTPIDESAPKGRLILPQQQTIRDILDEHCTVVVCQDTELKRTLSMLGVKPKLVITDSQAFGRVAEDTPDDIMLTSFSILFARYKGNLPELIKGASVLSNLKDGDTVLISEGCTHHRQCNDIGTVKMPSWIEKFAKAKLNFRFTSGGEFPDNLDGVKLIVHCGGCMLTEKEMNSRMEKAEKSDVPMVNYGIAIAQMNGILARSLEPFPKILKLL